MLGNAFELPTDISSVDFAAKQPLRALPLPSPLPCPLLICLVALSQDFWYGSSGSVLCSAAAAGSRSRGGQDGESFSFRKKLTSSACWLQKLLGCHDAVFCWHLQGPNFITRRTRGFLLNPQCCLGKSTQGNTGDGRLEVSVCVCLRVSSSATLQTVCRASESVASRPPTCPGLICFPQWLSNHVLTHSQEATEIIHWGTNISSANTVVLWRQSLNFDVKIGSNQFLSVHISLFSVAEVLIFFLALLCGYS